MGSLERFTRSLAAIVRKENARLKEANEILKLASAFSPRLKFDRKLK